MPAHGSTLNDHQRLLDFWRGRLIEAKSKYDQVVVEIQTRATDLTGILPAPQGSTKHILTAETHALDEYMRILQIFTDLVISGKASEDEPAQKERNGYHSAGR